ncbi:hypothetical protein Krac_11571 [Ktedonobacter racemifer DSM 44963]|uniref:Uncharacterized protein n=1 Tax=Ktedonobacter racemifer DSM 44963 TaxID=485913 RepID=D6TCG1_KTERA|nr:hypothetical protein Krac_11571 [Ktedonobacter racemifer DSM 44963]
MRPPCLPHSTHHQSRLIGYGKTRNALVNERSTTLCFPADLAHALLPLRCLQRNTKKASWGRKLANVAQHVVSYQEQGGDDARCTNLYSEVPPYSLAGRKKLFALKGRGRSGVIALRSGMKMCALRYTVL